MATGSVLLCGIAFGTGFLLGERQDRGEDVPTFTAGVPDDSLVELLARVEASADPDGGIRDLTFPNALQGGQTGPMAPPTAAAGVSLSGRVAAGGGTAPQVDPRPAGEFTLEIARFDDRSAAEQLREHLRGGNARAWIGAVREAGRLQYVVNVGGYSTADKAEDRVEGLFPLLALSPVPVDEAPAVKKY